MSGPIKAFGDVYEGAASYAAGKASNQNAQRNADVTLQEGAADSERIRSQARATMGEAIAAQGATGFQIGTGTALEQLRESKINSELDIAQVRRKAQISADTQRYKGALDLLEGKWNRAASTVRAAGDVATWLESKASASGGGG